MLDYCMCQDIWIRDCDTDPMVDGGKTPPHTTLIYETDSHHDIVSSMASRAVSR